MSKTGRKRVHPQILSILASILNAKGEERSLFSQYGIESQEKQREKGKPPFWFGNIQI